MRAVLLAASLACVIAATADAASAPRKLFYEETIPPRSSGTVSLKVRSSAAFRIVLRTSTRGRTRLYLTGATAPRGGPLMDTTTYACEGAAGSWYCRGAFEPLPRGTYTFRVRRDGPAAHVELTVRW